MVVSGGVGQLGAVDIRLIAGLATEQDLQAECRLNAQIQNQRCAYPKPLSMMCVV